MIISCLIGRFLPVKFTNKIIGSEDVLLAGYWCQQYPSHSVGDLVFDRHGALILTAGDGASFTFRDYGQGGGAVATRSSRRFCKIRITLFRAAI